jgi:protein-S-isoprenylcysteine O-methyltransferase Ste14
MARKRYENPIFTIGLFFILMAGIVTSILDPTGIGAWKGTINFDSITELNRFMIVLGLAMIIAGIAIRFVAIATLRRNFSGLLRIREGHTLVKNGIYKYVRHPAYFGAIVLFLGFPVMLSSIIGFVVMLLLVPYLLHRIKLEESMLIGHFGVEYKEYMKTSKKLIPFVY